jgi:hypothetical protein
MRSFFHQHWEGNMNRLNKVHLELLATLMAGLARELNFTQELESVNFRPVWIDIPNPPQTKGRGYSISGKVTNGDKFRALYIKQDVSNYPGGEFHLCLSWIKNDTTNRYAFVRERLSGDMQCSYQQQLMYKLE